MRKSHLATLALVALAACEDGSETGGKHGIPPIPAQMGPGLYAVGDGTQIYSRTQLFEDRTYADFDAAMEAVGGGTWRTDGATEICFDPAGDGADDEERCWSNGPPEKDGSFVSSRVGSAERYRVTPLKR